jgi:hypothetical protein
MIVLWDLICLQAASKRFFVSSFLRFFVSSFLRFFVSSFLRFFVSSFLRLRSRVQPHAWLHDAEETRFIHFSVLRIDALRS